MSFRKSVLIVAVGQRGTEWIVRVGWNSESTHPAVWLDQMGCARILTREIMFNTAQHIEEIMHLMKRIGIDFSQWLGTVITVVMSGIRDKNVGIEPLFFV